MGVAAPCVCAVLLRAVETGEVVAAGQPLALIVDLNRLELKVYVSANHLNRLHLGDEARIRVDGVDREFVANVSRIDDFAQFTPRDVHMPDERQRMVYGVTLALDNPDGLLKPGMPADAWIRWDATQQWPASLPVPASCYNMPDAIVEQPQALILQTEQLSRRFGETVAVGDISFAVRRGERVGVVGADGAGKTTLLQMLAGILDPRRGDCRVFGLESRPEAQNHARTHGP